MASQQYLEWMEQIRELEQTLAEAPMEMKPIVEQQLQTMKSLAPQVESLSRVNPPPGTDRTLSEATRRFFTADRSLIISAGIPDSTLRNQVTNRMLACHPEAQIYDDQSSLGCSISRGAGKIPTRHGLQLEFYANGRLKSQSFYEFGCLRWWIAYFATGGREHEGHYADTEPLLHQEHGLHTRYAEGGAITSQTSFHHGVLDGWSKVWEADGTPVIARRYERGNVVEDRLPDERFN